MERQRSYKWFIEPKDSHTNEVISRELTSEGYESETRDLYCNDDKQHNVYRVSYDFLVYVIASKDHLHLRFKVFVQEGNGQIRPADFIIQKLSKETTSKIR